MTTYENGFTAAFLRSLSVSELALLRHGLRQVPEDRAYRQAVDAEIGRRAQRKPDALADGLIGD